MGIEDVRYDNKRAVVLGGASGMGQATARLVHELGGWVAVLDVKDVAAGEPVDEFVRCDLRDRASIDAALAKLAGPIHAFFSCSGVADGTDGLMRINFLGQRYAIERLVAQGKMPRGSAVAAISSIGGFGWEKNYPFVSELLATDSMEAGDKWVSAHPDSDNYSFSKQAMSAYCARQSTALRPHGIRINNIAPGPVMTPLMAATEVWLGFEAGFRDLMQTPGAQPIQQAWPLVFLNSDAASFINGVTLTVDAGFVAGGISQTVTGPFVDAVLGQWL